MHAQCCTVVRTVLRVSCVAMSSWGAHWLVDGFYQCDLPGRAGTTGTALTWWCNRVTRCSHSPAHAHDAPPLPSPYHHRYRRLHTRIQMQWLCFQLWFSFFPSIGFTEAPWSTYQVIDTSTFHQCRPSRIRSWLVHGLDLHCSQMSWEHSHTTHSHLSYNAGHIWFWINDPDIYKMSKIYARKAHSFHSPCVKMDFHWPKLQGDPAGVALRCQTGAFFQGHPSHSHFECLGIVVLSIGKQYLDKHCLQPAYAIWTKWWGEVTLQDTWLWRSWSHHVTILFATEAWRGWFESKNTWSSLALWGLWDSSSFALVQPRKKSADWAKTCQLLLGSL